MARIHFTDGHSIDVQSSVIETQQALTGGAMFVNLKGEDGAHVIAAPAHVVLIDEGPSRDVAF